MPDFLLDPPTPSDSSPPLSAWLADPAHSYNLWLAKQYLEPSTCRVYSAMWGKFTQWLSGQHLHLSDCSSHEVWRFLETELPNKTRVLDQPILLDQPSIEEGNTTLLIGKTTKERKEQRQRYVRLIEKAYDHLADLGLTMVNPGREAGFAKMGKGSNAPTKFLDRRECELLFGVIQDFLVYPVPEVPAKPGIEWARAWASARDIGLAGVMVGAGVRVEEVGRMTVNCTLVRGSPDDGGAQKECLARMWIPAGIDSPGRDALCFPVAEMAISGWLKWRGLMPGMEITDVLFPSDVRKRRKDQRGAEMDANMHPSSLFRRISKVLTTAGVTGNRVGGQTLRNTYAALLVEAECTDAEIMASMGLKTAMTVLRLREKLKG